MRFGPHDAGLYLCIPSHPIPSRLSPTCFIFPSITLNANTRFITMNCYTKICHTFETRTKQWHAWRTMPCFILPCHTILYHTPLSPFALLHPNAPNPIPLIPSHIFLFHLVPSETSRNLAHASQLQLTPCHPMPPWQTIYLLCLHCICWHDAELVRRLQCQLYALS